MSTYTGKSKMNSEAIYSLNKPDINKPKPNNKPLETPPFTLGYIKDEPDSRDYLIQNILPTYNNSLNSIDYTNKMSPVKNQGAKGACVAFAIASVVEYQQQQEYLNEIEEGSTYKRNKDFYDLSEQWIYHKAKEIDNYPNQEGTSIRAGMKIINKHGAPVEKAWPYSDSSVGKPAFWGYSTARWNKNKKYYRITGLNELKKTLIEVGPCAIGVIVFREFFYPDNGVVNYPNNPNQYYGGHAICCVGFDDTKQLVKFKNSWDINWGLNGYGYLSYKYIQDFMIDAWVTVDSDVMGI